MKDSGLAARREALEPLGGSRVDLVDRLTMRWLRSNDLAVGLGLGLVDAREIMRIENGRAALQYPQDAGQRRIAAALSDEVDAVPEYLSAGVNDLMADVSSQRLWFGISLSLLLERWRRGEGDSLIEIEELCAAWGTQGSEAWAKLKPRGLDAAILGKTARRRLIGRAAVYVAQMQSDCVEE